MQAAEPGLGGGQGRDPGRLVSDVEADEGAGRAQGRGDVRVLEFGADSAMLLGVPRFLLRRLATCLLAAAGWTGVLQTKRALNRLFRAARTLGSIRQWRERRRANPPAAP